MQFLCLRQAFYIFDLEMDNLYRFIMCHYPPDSREYNQLVADEVLTEWAQREENQPSVKTYWLYGHTHTRQIQSEQVDFINVCIDFRYKNRMPIFCIEDFIQGLFKDKIKTMS
ncbi:hypothetical protein NHP190012_05430 [Helicobacter sp. NHP19-012]|uniref:Calcineurin-like phosphoesterase domain-containing protein n=1 Tax=Helicobacter gastrofelis TaxID=2849642 RepID=A0ABN6I5L7_9HELI|nr:hypothetical protein NHP190012_05430 [Helicobacter sp. NHP19-012]